MVIFEIFQVITNPKFCYSNLNYIGINADQKDSEYV